MSKIILYSYNISSILSISPIRHVKIISAFHQYRQFPTNGPIFGGYFYCRSDGSIWTAYKYQQATLVKVIRIVVVSSFYEAEPI
ncbi:hypothetical protein C1646_777176 [Rhizophagus diaphanus]|nr:hypothetical protein C1646_777176 [Rhizophagus diaphanus] [Rhizophagus sp. MUCL 43196]